MQGTPRYDPGTIFQDMNLFAHPQSQDMTSTVWPLSIFLLHLVSSGVLWVMLPFENKFDELLISYLVVSTTYAISTKPRNISARHS